MEKGQNEKETQQRRKDENGKKRIRRKEKRK